MKYGDGLIAEISRRLTKEFGRGFKRSNLRDMRKFYQTFPIYRMVCPVNCHGLII
ncbi:MAG: hypothetical protein K2J29_08860 [Muribaculaceae bacterium]|nr:DUF1016 domain-containing protein [Bacteroides sp.]MDE6804727.1 hypothetical protein [Muribaculaceae bacterium]